MAEKNRGVHPADCCSNNNTNMPIREAVCVDVSRVYDSCADKDCLEDLCVLFPDSAQQLIDCALSVRCRDAEVINVIIDVEEVTFNRGCYTVDLTYFFALTFDVYTRPSAPPVTARGICTFSKKCMLYGSDGSVRVFSSEYAQGEMDGQLPVAQTTPKAKVQVVEPMVLSSRVVDACDCCCDPCPTLPRCVCDTFEGSFDVADPQRHVLVTLGIFSIIQLERDVQLLIPAYDFCVPTKECSCETDNPCEVFRKVQFPLDEFFPPKKGDLAGESVCGCGCDTPMDYGADCGR